MARPRQRRNEKKSHLVAQASNTSACSVRESVKQPILLITIASSSSTLSIIDHLHIRHTHKMIARAAFRSALRATKAPAPLSQMGARRGYAEAVSDKLKLSFILPHEVRIQHSRYYQHGLSMHQHTSETRQQSATSNQMTSSGMDRRSEQDGFGRIQIGGTITEGPGC